MDNKEEKSKKERKILKKIIIIVTIFTMICLSVILYARYIGTKGINVNEIKLIETKL